jgi:hypothetical protein
MITAPAIAAAANRDGVIVRPCAAGYITVVVALASAGGRTGGMAEEEVAAE